MRRRGSKRERATFENDINPSPKERKIELSDKEYEGLILNLKQEMKRSSPRSGRIYDILIKTKEKRRQWINTSSPTSTELLEKYSCFSTEKWVIFL